MPKSKVVQRRAYLGLLPGTIDPKTGKVKYLNRREKKAFKAYLRGNTVFTDGVNKRTGLHNYFNVPFQRQILASNG